MARSAMKRLAERGATRATDLSYADAIVRKATDAQIMAEGQVALERTLEAADIVPDDASTPAAPRGVEVAAFARAFGVSWTPPPPEQHVARTVVRIRRVGTVATLVRTTTENVAIVENLALAQYAVEVAHVNRWKRQGPWSAEVLATPEPSAADRITAETRIVAGQTSDLLNDPGLAALTDPAKLAEAVVRSAALQGTLEPNLLRYDEAEFENYPLGALAGALNGAGVATTVVASPAPKRWLSVSRASGAAGAAARPFPGWRDRLEGEAAGTFFFSFQAKNTGAAPVRVQAQAEQSADGAAVTAVNAGAVATVQPGKTETVFVKFQTDATLVFQRFAIVLPDEGKSTLVNRQMLQRAAPAKAEPGPYRTPGLTVGVLHGQLIAGRTIVGEQLVAGTITAESGLLANAAIGNAQLDRATANRLQVLSADVVSLVAEKLRGGMISAQTFVLGPGGLFRTANNGTRLDEGGIALAFADSYNTPAIAADQKISSLSDKAAIAGYYDAAQNFRGWIVRSDGIDSEAARGAINLHATYGGLLSAVSTARVEVLAVATGGQVNLYQDAYVNRVLRVGNNLNVENDVAIGGSFRALLFDPSRSTSGSISPGATATVTWATPLPRAPRLVQVFINGEPLPTADNLVYVVTANATTLAIKNARPTTTAAVGFLVYVQA